MSVSSYEEVDEIITVSSYETVQVQDSDDSSYEEEQVVLQESEYETIQEEVIVSDYVTDNDSSDDDRKEKKPSSPTVPRGKKGESVPKQEKPTPKKKPSSPKKTPSKPKGQKPDSPKKNGARPRDAGPPPSSADDDESSDNNSARDSNESDDDSQGSRTKPKNKTKKNDGIWALPDAPDSPTNNEKGVKKYAWNPKDYFRGDNDCFNAWKKYRNKEYVEKVEQEKKLKRIERREYVSRRIKVKERKVENVRRKKIKPPKTIKVRKTHQVVQKKKVKREKKQDENGDHTPTASDSSEPEEMVAEKTVEFVEKSESEGEKQASETLPKTKTAPPEGPETEENTTGSFVKPPQNIDADSKAETSPIKLKPIEQNKSEDETDLTRFPLKPPAWIEKEQTETPVNIPLKSTDWTKNAPESFQPEWVKNKNKILSSDGTTTKVSRRSSLGVMPTKSVSPAVTAKTPRRNSLHTQPTKKVKAKDREEKEPVQAASSPPANTIKVEPTVEEPQKETSFVATNTEKDVELPEKNVPQKEMKKKDKCKTTPAPKSPQRKKPQVKAAETPKPPAPPGPAAPFTKLPTEDIPPEDLKFAKTSEVYTSLVVRDCDKEPTPADYAKLAKVTRKFYMRDLKLTYGKTFFDLQVGIKKTAFGAGIPEDRYNVYVVWSVHACFNEGETGKKTIPDNDELLRSLVDSLSMRLIDDICELKKTPFAKTSGLFMQQVMNRTPTIEN